MSGTLWIPRLVTITLLGISADFFYASGTHVGLIVFGGLALAFWKTQRGAAQ